MSPAPPDLLAELVPQVRDNCHRADAAVAGRFSLCGLLLRLRNLYKWEHGLDPWREEDSPTVLGWVDERESLWESLGDAEPRPLRLDGRELDPFDVEAINTLLAPRGLIYGAGRAGGLLPVFFLGELEATRSLDGLHISHVGREFCRDIFFLAGLRQGSRIYLRREPLPFLIWDLVADPRPTQGRLVDLGLRGYGLSRREVISEPSWEVLEPVLAGELEAVGWHEVGEAKGGVEAEGLLAQTLERHRASELEHFVRAVKDLLADTCPQGRLAAIIAQEAAGPLGFYPAWQAGFNRLLLPEIQAVVLEFARSADWDAVEEVRLLGLERAHEALRRLGPIVALPPGREAQEAARNEVIEPLTGFRSLPRE